MIFSPEKKACDVILFGALGDLSRRKLIPALYRLDEAGLLHEETRLIGVARDLQTVEHFQDTVFDMLATHLKERPDERLWARFKNRWQYVAFDLQDLSAYTALSSLTNTAQRTTVCYFATSPALYGAISQGLAAQSLNQSSTRVILEKPIGEDLHSSVHINTLISQHFKEEQIYRIDHYLGKETVLNLLVLRFANAIFASHWDHQVIDHVQITVAEEVGVEGRWGYYDHAGQMRDMVQNHLLQVLSLIAMEPPVNLDADSIRDEKLKVLKALRPINLSNVQQCTVRGQYTEGYVNGDFVPSYVAEQQANQQSKTETFVALKVNIDNWRWSGVPFYLRTGKRMAKKHSEVVIYFKPQPHNIFNAMYQELPPNKLIIRLQPDEGVEIQIMNKVPGLGESMQLQQSKLDLSFDRTFKSQRMVDAYERLLQEAMLGNQYLFVRRDEIEQAWRWVDGIIDAWKMIQDKPLPYQAGTWGPIAATVLLARDGHSWDE